MTQPTHTRPTSQPEQIVSEALLVGMPLRRSPLELAQDVLAALTDAGYWVVPLVGLTPAQSDQVHEATGHPLGTCMACQEFHLATDHSDHYRQESS